MSVEFADFATMRQQCMQQLQRAQVTCLKLQAVDHVSNNVRAAVSFGCGLGGGGRARPLPGPAAASWSTDGRGGESPAAGASCAGARCPAVYFFSSPCHAAAPCGSSADHHHVRLCLRPPAF